MCIYKIRKRIRVKSSSSNLGPLSGVRFDKLLTDRSSAFGEALRSARIFAEGPQGWLVFWGATGGGKTSLAAAIANSRINEGLPALYVVVPDLLDHLRAAYNTDSDIPYAILFEQVRSAQQKRRASVVQLAICLRRRFISMIQLGLVLLSYALKRDVLKWMSG